MLTQNLKNFFQIVFKNKISEFSEPLFVYFFCIAVNESLYQAFLSFLYWDNSVLYFFNSFLYKHMKCSRLQLLRFSRSRWMATPCFLFAKSKMSILSVSECIKCRERIGVSIEKLNIRRMTVPNVGQSL